jgi:hypothetical protein
MSRRSSRAVSVDDGNSGILRPEFPRVKARFARRSVRLSAVALATVGAALTVCSAQSFPQVPSVPTFRGSVEFFTIQVQVVAPRGDALPDLPVEKFLVAMRGRRQVVRYAELVRVDDGWAADSVAGRVVVNRPDVENFFRPFPKRASAQYILGIEVDQPRFDHVVAVKVLQSGLRVYQWMWRVAAAEPATAMLSDGGLR